MVVAARQLLVFHHQSPDLILWSVPLPKTGPVVVVKRSAMAPRGPPKQVSSWYVLPVLPG
jgi:hypothetical protein